MSDTEYKDIMTLSSKMPSEHDSSPLEADELKMEHLKEMPEDTVKPTASATTSMSGSVIDYPVQKKPPLPCTPGFLEWYEKWKSSKESSGNSLLSLSRSLPDN
jgi:hypothetical protein